MINFKEELKAKVDEKEDYIDYLNKEISKYISHCKGGEGCARDVIEQVLKAQDNWLRDDEATIW